MEHYFSFHGITNDMTKLRVGFLYLDLKRWQWWEWRKKCYVGYISWSQIVKFICAHFDHESHFLGWLTNLHQVGSIAKFIETFEQLVVRTKGLTYSFYNEYFISGLK